MQLKTGCCVISLTEQNSNLHLAKIPTLLFLFDNIDDDRNVSDTCDLATQLLVVKVQL